METEYDRMKRFLESMPRTMLIAPDLNEDEITTLARVIVGKLPPNTPIRPDARPSQN